VGHPDADCLGDGDPDADHYSFLWAQRQRPAVWEYDVSDDVSDDDSWRG
jgi:hypothetical protein